MACSGHLALCHLQPSVFQLSTWTAPQRRYPTPTTRFLSRVDHANHGRYLFPIGRSCFSQVNHYDGSSTSIRESLGWVCRFGPQLALITDQETQIRTELINNLVILLGVHHIHTSAYNPKANGMIEGVHHTLKSSLRARGHC